MITGADFKMAFDNAKVELRITCHGKQGARFNFVSIPQDELELLLVDGSRSQQGGFQTGFEPGRHFPVSIVEFIHGFQRMLDTLVRTVTERYLTMDNIPLPQLESTGNLLISNTDPAGVESERLGQKDELFTVITDLFFPLLSFRSSHHKVVLHAGEGAISNQETGKSPGLLQDKLHVQPAFGVVPADGFA